MITQAFRAGTFDFAVESCDKAVADLVDELFGDLVRPDAMDDELPRYSITRSTAEADPTMFDLSGPAVEAAIGLSLAGMLTRLVVGLSRATLDAEPDRLHLHAAGAVKDGRVAVLAAPRGTGKTTTLALLAQQGWSFISDEAVSIGRGDKMVRGYAKPLSIKPGSRSILSHLTPHLLPPPPVSDRAILHVRTTRAGGLPCTSATPHLIALMRRSDDDPQSKPRHREIHPADAVVGLMGETMDAARFGGDAVVELAHLVSRCRCHQIIVGQPDLMLDTIDQLFSAPAQVPLPVRELTDGRHVPGHVGSVLIGERVVIHERPEGRIVALDEAATAIWLHLGGWSANDSLDLAGPVVADFVRQLVALGFVSPEVLR